MSPNETIDDWARQCLETAEQYVQRYRWRLHSPVVIAEKALQLLCSGTAADPTAAVLGAYCGLLYAACSGIEGAPRQNMAYVELGNYLYGLVTTRYADLRADLYEDVVQSSLERIYRSFAGCREPVAFLAFASQHLLNAVRATRRRERRAEESLDQAVSQAGAGANDIRGLSVGGPDLPWQARITAIEQLFAEFLLAHPRAAQQVAVLRLSLIELCDDATISERLQISLASVQTARSRVLKTLRDEQVWIQRARHLGIFEDEV